jgi:hypothetical protein
MSAPNIDIKFSSGFTLGLTGGLDLSLEDLKLDQIAIKELPIIRLDPIKVGVAVAITELPPVVTDSKVALDLKVAVTQLPKIELEFGFKPMRIHFPTHYQFCFSFFGKEVFKFALCGESMVACEPYRPHETEKCG